VRFEPNPNHRARSGETGRISGITTWLSRTGTDDILLDEVLFGIESAVVVEDYPDSRKEPSVLVLQRDRTGLPIHVTWGVPKTDGTPAVLVTAYRPAPERWPPDFMKRKKL